jgi:hypothetical protein
MHASPLVIIVVGGHFVMPNAATQSRLREELIARKRAGLGPRRFM